MNFMNTILLVVLACIFSRVYCLKRIRQFFKSKMSVITNLDEASIGVEGIKNYTFEMMREFLPNSYKKKLSETNEKTAKLIKDMKSNLDKMTAHVKYELYDDKKARLIIQNGTWDEVVDYIQHTGGFLNVFARNGNLLYHAVCFQRFQIFKKLLQYGFNVDSFVPDQSYRIYDFLYDMKSTPIRDNMLKMAYILSRKVVNSRYRPMFKVRGWQADAIQMMKNNDFIYVERLIERHNADVRNIILDQGMFIHSAVINDCPNCIRVLLRHGVDPNVPYYGKYQLLNHILDVEQLDITGFTPLMIAVAKGSRRCVLALLESPLIEVTKGLQDNELLTARQLARDIKDIELRKLFLKRLHAREADSTRLSKWVEDVDLAKFSLKKAIMESNRKHIEFFFFNIRYEKFNPEWMDFAFIHSNFKNFKVIDSEFGAKSQDYTYIDPRTQNMNVPERKEKLEYLRKTKS